LLVTSGLSMAEIAIRSGFSGRVYARVRADRRR
jgi:hypothetical protein